MYSLRTKLRISRLVKWLPALLLMIVIFLFSARPGSHLPNFDWADRIVKKGGHMIGYALLTWSYWNAFDFRKDKRWIAWLMAVAYAGTDEFHQSFTAGRYPSVWDVLIFDNLGALLALWLTTLLRKRKQPERGDLVAGELKA